ncbi:hypothetical protein [Chryseobacterium sp. MMS23-Vi53]|uniref:hypothetical protein n=1 Tax=Chryseobacterium sp. MMS23-Vi53 TaxID=3386644 RepID=UPI0039EBB3A4
MKKTIFILSLVVSTGGYSQVGINTTNPKGVLDIVSTNSTMVIPRLPNPQNITNPVEGMLAYDSTNKTIRYYDGTNWSTLVYSKQEKKSNEGVVKINGGSAGAKPSWSNVAANTTRQVSYSSPLSFATWPTTCWPDNSIVADTKILKNSNQFVENGVMGQVHQWRIIINYTKNLNILSQDIRFILRNPISGFRSEISGVIPSSKTSGILVYNFITIADGASLPPPLGTGNGYIIEWIASDIITTLSIDSITRISFQKN